MEFTGGEEEGFVREWAPCTHMLSLIPPKVNNGLFSNELSLTCVDAVEEYIALGTNVGLVYWYDRKKGNIQRLRCEAASSTITFVKIVSTVDYMVGAGNEAGQVTVFQIPKEHPETVPENLKPKVEPKVERYTISDLHKSEITSIEWSKNGMKLFSGDKNGVIIMTEIDFYMHLCKSMEIVNEEHEIVQMSYHQSLLLVSSLYRSILCQKKGGKWTVTQVGKRDRKSLSRLGAVFQHSYRRGSGTSGVFCARPALRLWRADTQGQVLQTLMFKEAIGNPLTIAELLNPSHTKHSHSDREYNFGPLHIFREHFIVTHNEDILYILDPRSLTAVAVIDHLRKVVSVCVNKEEIFVLEGPRSLIRLGHAPETGPNMTDEAVNLMTKSLTTSIQQAVTSVRDFIQIEQTVPYIANQAIVMFTAGDPVVRAEECFERPREVARTAADHVDGELLQSIEGQFQDVTEMEQVRRDRTEELQKKLKMYNSIMEKSYDTELIHSSRRGRKKEMSSGESTPRFSTPVREGERRDGKVYTSSCVMSVSAYSDIPQDSDDKILEQQIEEKEKILAKMLDLESLSIPTPHNTHTTQNTHTTHNTYSQQYTAQDTNSTLISHNTFIPLLKTKNPQKLPKEPIKPHKKLKEPNPIDLIPKLYEIPKNWNLDNIQLRPNVKQKGTQNGGQATSPDDTHSEWEFL